MTRDEIEYARAFLKTYFPNKGEDRATFNTICDIAVRSLKKQDDVLRLVDALTRIANMPQEDNEWDAVEKYEAAKAIAYKVLMVPPHQEKP